MRMPLVASAVWAATLGACEPAPDPAAVEPDNTARNAIDRRTDARTPLDQSEKAADIAITAAIRREILRTEGLSADADNVKIVTEDGHVTLRGVVADEGERETVRSIAARVAGAERVTVDLAVETTPER